MAPSGRAAGIRPAGAHGGRRMACTVCIIHALQPGCKALEEHLSQWNDRLFVQDAQNPPPSGKRKTAARAGWAAALPSRAGRVNDKKVNEENSNIQGGAQGPKGLGSREDTILVSKALRWDTTYHFSRGNARLF